MKPWVEVDIRVRYAETDQMGVAHHAEYFVWFELARTEFCRKHGIDYRAMEADGLFLPVLEAKCRYRLAAHYDDLLVIRAEVQERPRRTLRTHYQVLREGAVLAEAETVQLLIDRQGKPRSFPPEIATAFGPSAE